MNSSRLGVGEDEEKPSRALDYASPELTTTVGGSSGNSATSTVPLRSTTTTSAAIDTRNVNTSSMPITIQGGSHVQVLDASQPENEIIQYMNINATSSSNNNSFFNNSINDTDSERMFMSEPSLSVRSGGIIVGSDDIEEEEEEDNYYHRRGGRGTSATTPPLPSHSYNNMSNPFHIPQQQPQAPNSPGGNTSLSSWETKSSSRRPSLSHHVQVQFEPEMDHPAAVPPLRHQEEQEESSTEASSNHMMTLTFSDSSSNRSIESSQQRPGTAATTRPSVSLSVPTSTGTDSEDDEAADIQQNRMPFFPYNSTSDTPDLMTLEQLEHDYEDNLRGTYQNVMRSHAFSQSPFANIGKKSVTKRPSHRLFLPQTSVLTDENDGMADQVPTYICPKCQTRQREFFGVKDAPHQLEGPTGYLAFYFSIYVLASLFIFGLEEGWAPIDCVYFSVVTLTTAGLGDFVPTTTVNKVVCSVFIYFGVACIGLLLGSYIAGMLDDKAQRDAKKKRIDSCPNCARIRKMKREAKAMNSPAVGSDSGPIGFGRKSFAASERNTDSSQHHQAAVYVSQRSHQKGNDITSSLPSRQTVKFGTPPMQNEKVYGTIDTPGHSSTSTIGSMGSPVTQRILAQQKHTRHDSFDTSFHSMGLNAQPMDSRSRRYSEDFKTPHPINESDEFLPPTSAPDPRKVNPFSYEGDLANDPFMNDDENDENDDDDQSCSSAGSTSTGEEILDERKAKLQAAKYVFVTLRQALVNSMIIIAVGCAGFVLIEGFTVIDSWYFVTVFLTTVGYGDIVPVTKGGKLFATVYILVAGTILLNNMSLISMIPLELRRRRIERAVLTQFGDQLDDAALKELATGPVIQNLHLAAHRPNGLDEATREMFSLAMLVRLGKVSEEDILQTFAAFRRLDVNNEGVLNSRSIIAAMYKKRKSVKKPRQSAPPPPPSIPTEDPVSTHEPMRGYWVGQRGSLHVDTPDGVYYFDRLSGGRSSGHSDLYGSSVDENSRLLRSAPNLPAYTDDHTTPLHPVRESPI